METDLHDHSPLMFAHASSTSSLSHGFGSAPAGPNGDIECQLIPASNFRPRNLAGKYIALETQSEYAGDDLDDEAVGQNSLLGFKASRRLRPSHAADKSYTWNGVTRLVIETAPTLLITTIGLLLTGELLTRVAHWRAMTSIDEFIIVIPIIFNLKGNLEMNLSSRLGTAAHIGLLDERASRNEIVFGNLTLLQVQAAVASFVAANLAFLLGRELPLSQGHPVDASALVPLISRGLEGDMMSGIAEYWTVVSTTVCATCLSSLFLGSFMCALVVLCRKGGIDPDNIAPPIASCLGDLVTLILLGSCSSLLLPLLSTRVPFGLALITASFALLCFAHALHNAHVRPLLTQGWVPLGGAVLISGAAGVVLDRAAGRYDGFALLAVLISGLPGSTGAVLVSRLSTALHASAASGMAGLPCLPGALPDQRADRTAPSDSPNAHVATLTLLLTTLPISVLVLALLRALGWLRLPAAFCAAFVLVLFLAVTASLLLARALTTFLWARAFDPDVYALPIHSAVVDLVGLLLLVGCYEVVPLDGVSL